MLKYFSLVSSRCEDESIDELAAHFGHGEAVAALTTKQALLP